MSKHFDSKGREVEINKVNLEIGEGAYVQDAYYMDDASEVPDSELDYLTDTYQAELYQEAYEHKASAAYDRAKDYSKYGDD